MASLLLKDSTVPARGFTRAGKTLSGPHPLDEQDQFRIERTFALLFILAAAAWLRVLEPGYSTAYMDESIYVVYGRMFLSRHFEAPLDTPLQWSFGWYLWPAMASLADRLGGLAGLRELSAALGVVTVASVYGFTSRIFSKATGMAAAAIMALLAPAVLVSRIATRDSGSIAFFALGLWAFACAWRKEKTRYWVLTGICLFAAFLCKYLVAVYFPFLVILTFWKGRKPLLYFSLPLFLACAAYGILHAHDLAHLLSYGAGYNSLRAPAGQVWQIYVGGRLDFWLLALAALPVFFLSERSWRVSALVLLVGVAVIMVVQWKTRADFDYWKHVNYALLFLAPLAAAGIVALAQRVWKEDHFSQMFWGACGVMALAACVAWAGKATKIEQFIFWPDVNPILAWFEGRLAPGDRVLADDTVLRYYFHPPLGQNRIVDPMYFEYGGATGEEAYKTAVREGAFDYVVLDGGVGEEARRLDNAVRPLLGGYELQLSAVEPTRGQQIEIYAKSGRAVAAEGQPGIRIVSPATKELVKTTNGEFLAQGVATGAGLGWYARLEVFTNRWYQQGPDLYIAPDGAFRQNVRLGGEGKQQCYHLLRARLYDPQRHIRATTMNYEVARAHADGSNPGCRTEAGTISQMKTSR